MELNNNYNVVEFIFTATFLCLTKIQIIKKKIIITTDVNILLISVLYNT
jgi:hypothetical protein